MKLVGVVLSAGRLGHRRVAPERKAGRADDAPQRGGKGRDHSPERDIERLNTAGDWNEITLPGNRDAQRHLCSAGGGNT